MPLVRVAERGIAKKLKAFAALCASGRLCDERSAEIAAVAAGNSDGKSVKLAKAHIKHCSVCKIDYVAQLRAVRSATFQRDVASLVPVLPLAETARQYGGSARDLIADWISRLGSNDVSAAATHAASSGVGRGAGGVLAVKIAAALAAGATTVGVTTGIVDGPSDQPKARSRPAAKSTPTPTPEATPDMKAAIAAAKRAAAQRRARRANSSAKKTQGGTGPTDQEKAPASPAPAGSLPNGGSEFTPDSSNSAPAPPAPVPAAPGASEFP